MKISIPTKLSKIEGFILRIFQTTLEGGWMNLPFISAQECWDADRLVESAVVNNTVSLVKGL